MAVSDISARLKDIVPSEGRVGLLLLNLGTPDNTDYFSVRRYLKEFLSDRRVIEAPRLIWQPLLHGLILTRRPSKSGTAYRRVWNTHHDASPLRVITNAQVRKVAERLSPSVTVIGAMRYGKPSMEEGLRQLLEAGCDRIVLLPLYPQYSAATTATANDHLFRALMKLRYQPALATVPPFPDHPLYIKSLAKGLRAHLEALSYKPQRIILSFHGMPQRCIDKGDPYAMHCERTAIALRREMGMAADDMPLTFQSRFGPMAWLQPYTAPYVEQLARQGIQDIAVITPGFMADCLETLDEIGNELRESFLHAGGRRFSVVPCLNDHDDAIALIEALARPLIDGLSAGGAS